MRRILSLALLVALALPGLAAAAEPQTLSAVATIDGGGPERPPHAVDFLGVHWEGDAAGEAAVRFRRDGRWGPWQALHRGDAHPPGRTASELVAAGGAGAYEVRAPAGARDVRAVAINTTDGAPASSPGRPPTVAPPALPCYRPRAVWGADETIGTDARSYFPVQALTVHHTATDTGDADPAAVVRAIQHYHVVDLGFDDIGYQLLIDERGCVYEGRSSGDDPTPVFQDLRTPGGVPLAVNGAHVTGFNAANVGVALIGEFTEAPPSGGALRSLAIALAGLAKATGLDPQGTTDYVNPITGAPKTVRTISAHRDWLATECPGEAMVALLPGLRERVASLLGRV